uniref:Uncharacterized protein n=1 Tax=Anguilla anguilla TaxID=7936 RepID=A0A0E9SAM6_ANGAN
MSRRPGAGAAATKIPTQTEAGAAACLFLRQIRKVFLFQLNVAAKS